MGCRVVTSTWRTADQGVSAIAQTDWAGDAGLMAPEHARPSSPWGAGRSSSRGAGRWPRRPLTPWAYLIHEAARCSQRGSRPGDLNCPARSAAPRSASGWRTGSPSAWPPIPAETVITLPPRLGRRTCAGHLTICRCAGRNRSPMSVGGSGDAAARRALTRLDALAQLLAPPWSSCS